MLNLFGTVLNQLTTLIKKSLQKHNFLALSAYDALLQQQHSWEEVLSRRGSEYFDDKNELRDGLQALRQICLRSFPEFLVDLKLGANNRDLDTSVKVVDPAVQVENYNNERPNSVSTHYGRSRQSSIWNEYLKYEPQYPLHCWH